MKKIEEAGVTVVAISYDATDILADFAKSKSITFPLLSDPKAQTIDAYGNREKGQDFAVAGTFLVDKEGVVRAKLFLEGYKERHSTEALIEVAKKLK